MNYKVLETPRVNLGLRKDENEKNKPSLAILGHLVGGEKVRKYLRQFTLEGQHPYVSDLGNIVSEHCSDAGNIVTDLVENRDHVPILICNSAIRQSLKTQHFHEHFMRPTYISSRQSSEESDNHIGLQAHLISSDWQMDCDKHLRLGQLQTDITAAEVILRNSDYINIDLNVLRYADNPGPKASTAGLTIEELCMLAKYSGASTQLQAISITGYNQHQDAQEITARNVAMLIWYLIDGYRLRRRELNHVQSERLFTVIPDDIDGELTFVENQNTGRWWVEVYSESAEKEIRMACGHEDYEAACQNEISDRLASILTKV